MNKPVLTPRQQEAKAIYGKSMKSAFWLGLLIYIAAVIGISILWRLLAPPTSRFSANIISVFAVPLWLLAHSRAIKKVRRAGLLDEESEIVERTATTFAGEDMAFQYPSNILGKLALLTGAIALTGFNWWFWRYFAANFFEYALGAFGFALFGCATLLTLATMNQPNASLNERGIFAYRFSFIPTLVRWSEIESAIFTRVSNIHTNAEAYTITLKDADDKTLLILNPNTFMGSPPQWQQHFLAELKRRLTGETAP